MSRPPSASITLPVRNEPAWLASGLPASFDATVDFDGINFWGQYTAMGDNTTAPVHVYLQFYVGNSQVFGRYGDQWEVRVGENFHPMKQRGIRINGEWIYVDHSPVGYTAYPMPVGAKGNVFHINLELNF